MLPLSELLQHEAKEKHVPLVKQETILSAQSVKSSKFSNQREAFNSYTNESKVARKSGSLRKFKQYKLNVDPNTMHKNQSTKIDIRQAYYQDVVEN